MIMVFQPKHFLQLCNWQVEPSVELGSTKYLYFSISRPLCCCAQI
jgi:hypothetical protein